MNDIDAAHATSPQWQQVFSGPSLLDVLAANVDGWQPLPHGDADWPRF